MSLAEPGRHDVLAALGRAEVRTADDVAGELGVPLEEALHALMLAEREELVQRGTDISESREEPVEVWSITVGGREELERLEAEPGEDG